MIRLDKFNLSDNDINKIIRWDVPNWEKIIPIWLSYSKKINNGIESAIEIGGRKCGLSFLMCKLNVKEVYCSDIIDLSILEKSICEYGECKDKIHCIYDEIYSRKIFIKRRLLCVKLFYLFLHH